MDGIPLGDPSDFTMDAMDSDGIHCELCISPKGLGTLCSVSARCSTSAWGDASKND